MSSVSVVIPCYSYGHFLEAAVSSVLDDQDGVDVRVLIIDDASPDDSAAVAREIASRRYPVEVIVHDVNRGQHRDLQRGTARVGRRRLLPAPVGRRPGHPGALARARDLLDAHPEVGMVYGRALWSRTAHPSRRPGQGAGMVGLVRPGVAGALFRQAENPLTTPEVVVRTSLQHQVGGYDPQLPKAADMELFMRLAAHAHVGFIRGVDQAFYRRHGTNMSKTVTPDGPAPAAVRLRGRAGTLRRQARGHGPPVRMVHRQLSREALWAAGRVYDRGRLRESDLGRRLVGGGVTRPSRTSTSCWRSPPTAGRRSRGRLYRTLEARRRLGPRAPVPPEPEGAVVAAPPLVEVPGVLR